jgi:predicted amidohydrolase
MASSPSADSGPPDAQAEGVRVRAVSLRLRLTAEPDAVAMARTMVAKVVSARGEGGRDLPLLAVFPGLYGLGLVGPWSPELPWLVNLRASGRLLDLFAEAASRVARTLRAYVVPGSLLVWDGGAVREWSGLFGPEGDLLGEQEATQPDTQEEPQGLGSQLRPIRTPFGMVGLLLGRDAEVPEVGRILTLMGARLLVAPRAPKAPYSSLRAMAGLWQVVQQNRVYGVESGLFGPAAGKERDGKAGVFAPGALTPDGHGFLGRPGYYVGEGGVAAVLDMDRLETLRASQPLGACLRPAVYRRYRQAFGGWAPPGGGRGTHGA